MQTLPLMLINARFVPSIRPRKQSSLCSPYMYHIANGRTWQLTSSPTTTKSNLSLQTLSVHILSCIKPLPNQHIPSLENYKILSANVDLQKDFFRRWTLFLSEALQEFLALQYIDHTTPSPHYPKSNGFIEK